MPTIHPAHAPAVRADKNNADADASLAPAAAAWHIHGLSEVDNWETLQLAKYKQLTGNYRRCDPSARQEGALVKRRSDSEPDLLNRRRPQFAKPRLLTGLLPQHRRSSTFPGRDVQPWVYTVRETRSCPIAPRPASELSAEDGD